MVNDPGSELVNHVWVRILGREATPQEKSKYRTYGQPMLEDIARTIIYEERHENESFRVMDDAQKTVKHFGVSFVSPFNKQCGISTYTENLYKNISAPKGIIAEDCAKRNDCVEEENVKRVWSIGAGDLDSKIIKQASEYANKIVHIQHEFGIFADNDMLYSLILKLKQCGFKVVITLHTVMRSAAFDNYYRLADVIIVHSEAAASRLYGKGINNVTVIKHGTYEKQKLSIIETREILKEFNLLECIYGCSVGFISKDKMQEETLKAVDIAMKTSPIPFKFIMAGNTGRREYDDDYFPLLEKYKNDRIIVEKKFLSDKEIATLLGCCHFSVMNYHPTNYSISGASHLLMTYGVPSISSDSLILGDLTPSMSIKVKCDDVYVIASAIHLMLNDTEMRNSMASNALAAGKATSWDKMAAEHERVYRSICDE